MTGEYLAEWSKEGDCDTVAGTPPDIVTGPLAITGTAGDLVFDFEEATFDGTIDETFSFGLADAATIDGWTVTLTGEGLAYISGDLWVLEGDLEMNATDSIVSCTAGGTLTATQLGSGS